MIGTLIPRFDAMPPAQRRLWPELRPSLELGFVLYGGTAIALHLGHRRSIDFDFFHDQPLDKEAIRAAFPFMRRAATLQDGAESLVVAAPSGARPRRRVKLSFFGRLTFGRVGEPLLTDDGVLQVAALDDLVAHKLKVILQRAERKDYADLAAMIRAGSSLGRGLAAARLFFGNAFQPAESLKAMVYFQDGDLARLSRRDRETLVGAAAAVGRLPGIALRSRKLAIRAGVKSRGPGRSPASTVRSTHPIRKRRPT